MSDYDNEPHIVGCGTLVFLGLREEMGNPVRPVSAVVASHPFEGD